jgi:L-seryl-tRNA(Ser) seleniumtransferase
MTASDANALLRSIPAMDDLLNESWAVAFSTHMGRDYVKQAITEVLDSIRREINDGMHTTALMGEVAASRVMDAITRRLSSTLKKSVNATGVVIHTNLGRAPLAFEALQAVNDTAGTYNTLEYSPEKGRRVERNSHVEWLICHLTGAEAALVVNNNAAAVLLALSATASGREVIVSSGELVEIGDSFRLPEILSFSGAQMVAVGCTNSTRIADYRKAISENTAVLLKVHPSNYRITGFTASTSREELAELSASRALVFMEDLGSGLLCPLAVPFASREHSARECLEAGVGIVTFSGDKLLGGPQIGVIAGSKAIIDRMRSHQLHRALRVDKMTLAAFEATLRMYVCGRHGEIPVIRMIETDPDELLKKARRLCRVLHQAARGAGSDAVVAVIETDDAIGGGAFPTDRLPGFGVGIRSASRSAESLALALRTGSVPVIPGLRDGQVILHVRTLLDGDERIIVSSFTDALVGAGS